MRIPMLMTVCSVSVLLNLLSNTALAQAPKSILTQENNQGWSSTMGLYLIAIEGKSSRSNIVDDGKQTNVSLNTEPSDYDFSTVFPILRVNYTLPTNTYFSLGLFDTGLTTNSLIDTQSLVDLSFNHTFDNDSTIWTSYSPNIPGLYEVWQDPYQTGKPLEKTDVSLNVLAFGVDYILGSPLSISTSIGEQKIKKERAGDSLSASLNANELKKLNRDVRFSTTKLSLTKAVINNLYLEGGLSYFYADAEGEANSFNAKGLDLSLSYISDSFDFYIAGEIQQTEFASYNPVFNRKRDEDNYNVHIGASYKDPFGWGGASLDALLGVSNRDSNIAFFDEESVAFTTGLSYDF